MLTHLSIRNIVLIDACDIAFESGLCVLTGETGAGKSILLDALGLALGARTDAGLVRHGQAQGSVMAEFDISANARARGIMAELELEEADQLIIRRNIGVDGKNRCFANDAALSVSALKRIGETLVEVHGQHDQRGLMDSATHRGLLDEFGRLQPAAARVSAAYRAWRDTEKALDNLKQELEQGQREEEYLRHLAMELKTLDPQPGEEETLTNERIRMMQGEKLFATLKDASQELEKDKGLSAAVRSAQRILLRSPLHGSGIFANAIDALERAANEIDDAETLLAALSREAAYDPRELEKSEERLFALKAAARKYGAPVDALADLRADAEKKLKTLDSRERELARLQKAREEAKSTYAAEGAKLTEARRKAAAKLEKSILAELGPLKMGNARVRVKLEPLAESAWCVQGMESVTFEVATNVAGKGEIPFSPLAKIASGGELSRFMLALKVALSEVRSTPTLIFDEIDTGTGGAVADAIGQRLARLGEAAQVLVVTHMPQVAARGRQHLRISKQEKKSAVTTNVEGLALEERKEEVARMLAGASVTAEARRAAAKLLEDAA